MTKTIPFKYIVKAIFIEQDETGNIIGESFTDELTLYGKENVREWLEAVDQAAAKANINEPSTAE